MLHNDMLIHKLSIFVSSVAFFANPRALSQRLFGAAVRSPISSCRTRERKRSIRQSKAFIGQLVPSPIFPQIVNTPSETWFGIGTTYWIILELFMLASHMFIFGGRVIFVSSQALTSTAKQLDSKMRGNNGPLPDIKVGGRGRALQWLVGKRTKQTETNRVGSWFSFKMLGACLICWCYRNPEPPPTVSESASSVSNLKPHSNVLGWFLYGSKQMGTALKRKMTWTFGRFHIHYIDLWLE